MCNTPCCCCYLQSQTTLIHVHANFMSYFETCTSLVSRHLNTLGHSTTRFLFFLTYNSLNCSRMISLLKHSLIFHSYTVSNLSNLGFIALIPLTFHQPQFRLLFFFFVAVFFFSFSFCFLFFPPNVSSTNFSRGPTVFLEYVVSRLRDFLAKKLFRRTECILGNYEYFSLLALQRAKKLKEYELRSSKRHLSP